MKITKPSAGRRPGRRKGRRLAGSLAVGAAVAGFLVAWEDLHNHAALVAAAAGPQPKGVHETVGSILATGGIVTALVVAGVVFVIATVLARRRDARSRAGQAAEPRYSPVVSRRRSRASARW
jgi:hypothetical protein